MEQATTPQQNVQNSGNVVIDKNYMLVLLGSLITLFTSGGVLHTSLNQPMDNNTTQVPQTICNNLNVEHVFNAANFSSSSAQNTTTTAISNANDVETLFIYLFSIILPMCPFVPLIVDSITTNVVGNGGGGSRSLMLHTVFKPIVAESFFTHLFGQAGAFASTEALQYFIIYPNQIFFDNCGLKSKQECTEKFQHDGKLFLNQICNVVQDNQQSISSESLHSMPQLVLVMLGASLVMFFYCYKQATNVQYDAVSSNNLSLPQKMVNFSKTKSCKLLMLLIMALLFGSCFLYLMNKNDRVMTWSELMYSFFSGVLLQCVCIYILKFKIQTPPSFTPPQSFPPSGQVFELK